VRTGVPPGDDAVGADQGRAGRAELVPGRERAVLGVQVPFRRQHLYRQPDCGELGRRPPPAVAVWSDEDGQAAVEQVDRGHSGSPVVDPGVRRAAA
jgi:hypothetical protein